MINSEDSADVKRNLGAGVAKKVASVTNDSKNRAIHAKTAGKKIANFQAIKEHVSGVKKPGGFNDPFWYSKK